ncbi:MAG: serine/threonine protein kinase [Polyangiaceae bacterium]|nr:serine/threonine protein kinase [Polyangiaceae bacterium]
MGPGSLIANRFEIVRKIARGGMADVFEARDSNGQRVAIKLLRDGLSKDPEVVARFQREGRAVSTLTSKHVVRVLDFGTAHEERPFMVLEFLSGADLAKELAKRTVLPLDEAASYLAQACHAMIEAHDAGIVHRDLKPTNIVLAEENGRRIVKLVDFGISKITRGPIDDHVTATNALFGSPLYMSPETFRSAKLADARSDIWSLGVIFYEMITGFLPFHADNAVAVGLCVTREPHIPPSVRKLGLPGSTDVVIARALKKDPNERYQTTRELLAALEVFMPRGRNETMAIPRVVDPAGADDDPRTVRRDVVTELGMVARPSIPDPTEAKTAVVTSDHDEHDQPTRAVPPEELAAHIDATDAPTRIRTSVNPSSIPSLTNETGRVAVPVSLSAPPGSHRKRIAPTLWLVPAAAVVFGLGGWLLAKSGDPAASAAQSTHEVEPDRSDTSKNEAVGTAVAKSTATTDAHPTATAAPSGDAAAPTETAFSTVESSSATTAAPEASSGVSADAPPAASAAKRSPKKRFVPKGI